MSLLNEKNTVFFTNRTTIQYVHCTMYIRAKTIVLHAINNCARDRNRFQWLAIFEQEWEWGIGGGGGGS